MIDAAALWFAAQGCGTVGVDLFKGKLPGTPPNAAAIMERPGLPPVDVFGGTAWEQPRWRILVRATSYAVARARAERFYRAALTIANLPIGGSVYLSVEPLPPAHADLDELLRPILEVTMEVRRTLTTPVP